MKETIQQLKDLIYKYPENIEGRQIRPVLGYPEEKFIAKREFKVGYNYYIGVNYFEDGKLAAITWVKLKNGNWFLHRVGGPASYTFRPFTEEVLFVEYYLHGIDYPNEQKYYKACIENGFIEKDNPEALANII